MTRNGGWLNWRAVWNTHSKNASANSAKKSRNPTQMVRGAREVVSDITSTDYNGKTIGSKGVAGKKKPHRKTSAVF